jgi:hypothetical protein
MSLPVMLAVAVALFPLASGDRSTIGLPGRVPDRRRG